jgi:hypothetical protein
LSGITLISLCQDALRALMPEVGSLIAMRRFEAPAPVSCDGRQWAQDEPSIRGLIALPPSSRKKKCAQTGTPLLVLVAPTIRAISTSV